MMYAKIISRNQQQTATEIVKSEELALSFIICV